MFSKIPSFVRVLFQSNQCGKIRFLNVECNFSNNAIGIIGAPFSKGQAKPGTEKAPDLLRKYGLVKQLQDLDLDVKDYGNIQFEELELDLSHNLNKIKNPLSVGSACQKVSEAVRNVILENRVCVTLGGDHSLGIGTVHGHSQVHDTCLLWVDAHADINTTFTSATGNMHGMPVAFLIKELKRYQTSIEGFKWLEPCINKSNVAFIGLRDIDPLEKLILVKEKILHFTMRDIDEYGIIEVTKKALKAINPSGNLSLHVSFDVDSLDTALTPSTGTPVIGGLTIREALCIAEEIFNLGYLLNALDIVEVNPKIGSKEQLETTVNVSILIAKAFLGYSRNGRVPSNVQEIPIQ